MAARAVPAVAAVNEDHGHVVEAEYDLEEILRQKQEAVGGFREVTFSFGGAVFSIPHPAFMTDEMAEDIEYATSSIETAVLLLGSEDEYNRFRDHGGQATYVAALFEAVDKKTRDTDAQGRPTRFAPSSREQRRAQRRR